jgi:hypothetical protein
LRGNLFGQSLTNNRTQKGNFFIGQQNIPIHFFPILIKKNTNTSSTSIQEEPLVVKRLYRPFPFPDFSLFPDSLDDRQIQ